MKYLPLLLLPLFTTVSCKKAKQGNSCEDVICTMEFRTVSVKVNDQNNNFVKLDDYYTIRTGTGDTIRNHTSSLIIPDNYIVLTDGYRKKMENQTDVFRFVGVLNGNIVVDQPMTISADCCHITRESGPSEIKIN